MESAEFSFCNNFNYVEDRSTLDAKVKQQGNKSGILLFQIKLFPYNMVHFVFKFTRKMFLLKKSLLHTYNHFDKSMQKKIKINKKNQFLCFKSKVEMRFLKKKN